MTGLKAGGISPLALINRGFEFLLDQSALKLDQVYISGGQIGMNIHLSVQALIEIVHPKAGNISQPKI